VNVGGKNLVKMADLRAMFEDLGFADVATYIQSGNVLFRAPKERRDLVETRDGVDEAWPGKGVIYFSRLASKASSSRLSKIVALPEYQNMTIRSWSTTSKLATLMGQSAADEA
jgi:uncharacterized protein (DUF1697 family)